MSADQIAFVILTVVVFVKVECSFQHMDWYTWPPRWLAGFVLLVGVAAGLREIIVSNWSPGWLTNTLLMGVVLLLAFDRRRPTTCKRTEHHPV